MGVSALAQIHCMNPKRRWRIEYKHGQYIVTRIRDDKELARSKSEHTALELAKKTDKES